MKKYWFISLLLVLTGCEEAHDIFGWEEYFREYSFQVNVNGYEQSYEAPIYVDATSWGAVAYVQNDYVNKGIKLLISESNDAEGGKEFDVTSNAIAVNDLSVNTQYYYCLFIPSGNIKSNIKSVVVPEVSALELKLTQEGDSVICAIQDSISSVLIYEKGFKLNNGTKIVMGDNDFFFSISETVEKYNLTNDFRVYAYVQTANAYHRSHEINVDLGAGYTNTEHITISAISEETFENVDYLKCTVTGCVDSVYFYSHDYAYESRSKVKFYPDSTVVSKDGNMATYYLKKDFHRNVYLKAFYRLIPNESNGYVRNYEMVTSSYTPTHYKISTLDEFLKLVSVERDWDGSTILLHADITLPSDIRLGIKFSNLTFDGNEKTLNGISYFPLFHNLSNVTIKNLKIGTDTTEYNIKKGTNGFSTTSNEVPRFFLWGENKSHEGHYYDFDSVFENCEVRGTFKVSGRYDFYVCPVYTTEWSAEDREVGTFDEYIERIPGLKDYTKTEYVTTNK